MVWRAGAESMAASACPRLSSSLSSIHTLTAARVQQHLEHGARAQRGAHDVGDGLCVGERKGREAIGRGRATSRWGLKSRRRPPPRRHTRPPTQRMVSLRPMQEWLGVCRRRSPLSSLRLPWPPRCCQTGPSCPSPAWRSSSARARGPAWWRGCRGGEREGEGKGASPQ